MAVEMVFAFFKVRVCYRAMPLEYDILSAHGLYNDASVLQRDSRFSDILHRFSRDVHETSSHETEMIHFFHIAITAGQGGKEKKKQAMEDIVP